MNNREKEWRKARRMAWMERKVRDIKEKTYTLKESKKKSERTRTALLYSIWSMGLDLSERAWILCMCGLLLLLISLTPLPANAADAQYRDACKIFIHELNTICVQCSWSICLSRPAATNNVDELQIPGFYLLIIYFSVWVGKECVRRCDH